MCENQRQRIATVGIVWTCLSVTFVAALTSAQTAPRPLSLQESRLRQLATTHVMPEYPAASVARGADGVAVAHISTGIDDRVDHVDVLQSPDADTADAIRAALTRWVVPVAPEPGSTVRRAVQGLVTFYFQIRSGKGVVLNPDQMTGNEDVFVPPARPGARASGPPTVTQPDMAGIAEIDELTLRRLLEREAAVLLDVRGRQPFAASARPRGVNIPIEELTVRAGAELPRASTIVVDCSQEQTFRCRAATQFLRQRGFTNVAIYLP